MKKTIIFLGLFIAFISKVNASDTFYLGDHVPNIYIYMNRINKKVYRQFRMIYKSGTNELVYCIEPGTSLANDIYETYNTYNSIFNISLDKWERLKLIAYYGYNYNNHTDIKWYAITQYIIWHEVMPSEWELYFVDENHNKLVDQYKSEINEIYTLVNNHSSSLNISSSYTFNYNDDVVITSNNKLSNYAINKGNIRSSKIYIDDVKIGLNNYSLNFKNYKEPLYYYNGGGQNILSRGDVFKKNINFSIYITAGKVKINECNEETFNQEFNGGIYEVLDQDDEVIDTVMCNSDGCISTYLPVGFYKIRVKELSNEYELNEHIYDVEVKDGEESEINICSLKKKPIVIEMKKIILPEENTVDETENISEENNETYEEIAIPYTYKSTYMFNIVILISFVIIFVIGFKYESNN